jgi:hypothetical protein
MEFSQVLTFRKGKVVMAEYFWDHQETLEAAGLSDRQTAALDEKRRSGPQLRNPDPRVAPELSARAETRLARVRVGESWPGRAG